ncbi:hypothetical protein VNO78_30530 [Psophocarpus tetragonolobus]|uniref:Selenoprotein H n=1 Tax=Psophocarpus tetragonolobus TaxID=3891 RepID=A0AAN9RWY2_PSOTE
MSPAKRKDEAEAPAEAPATMRVTRAAAKRSATTTAAEQAPEKKAKKEKGPKKQKKSEKENKGEEKEGEASENVVAEPPRKTLVVEHCKQCNSFKTRANMVKQGIEKADKGVRVILNPEKPRRGCFEIREQEGKTFISLLDMKRPFKPMKDLDMDKVISDIIDEISKD